ncbi:MAG: hypothetical protein ACD_76C00102G0004 [uncultured bacterium]|nr:MAG: hypothetical protein ACD_76C00102G0004 [uncultured bacterium]HBD05620.1 ribosome biogenesis GTPase Der [Candidatus Uhrbacteria bacterium]
MDKKTTIPRVAIIGRTNVGKSTLYNRLTEQAKALVSPLAGTTRDVREGNVLWQGTVACFMDTGGLDVEQKTEIEKNAVEMARLAMKIADVIMFVVDIKTGILPEDRNIAQELVKTKKPVIIVGNKADKLSYAKSAEGREWTNWPLSRPIPVSSASGSGTGDMLDEVWKALKKCGKKPVTVAEARPMRIMVYGKPNAGKSSLLNTILGEKRFITSPIAYTTREPNDTILEANGKEYLFIDTVGLRKNIAARRVHDLEQAGADRTKSMLRVADIVLYVLDVSEPIKSQDKNLIGEITDSHAGIIIVANKWDLIKDKKTDSMNEFTRYIRAMIPFADYAPIIFTSASTGKRVDELLPIIDSVQNARFTQIQEEQLELFLKHAIKKHLPARGKGAGHPKIFGLKQIGIAPPRFELALRGARADALHPSYLRFLERQLRERFGFLGTTIRLSAKAQKSV